MGNMIKIVDSRTFARETANAMSLLSLVAAAGLSNEHRMFSIFFMGISLGAFSANMIDHFNKVIRISAIRKKLNKIAASYGMGLKIDFEAEPATCSFIPKDIDIEIDEEIITLINEALDKTFKNDVRINSGFERVTYDNLNAVWQTFGGLNNIRTFLDTDISHYEKNDNPSRNLSDEFLVEVANRLSLLEDEEEFISELNMYHDEYDFTNEDYERLTELIDVLSKQEETKISL